MRNWAVVFLAIFGVSTAQTQSSKGQTVGQITRPGPEGIPTVVIVNAFVADVITISDVAQSFNADVYITATWNDPRLAGATARSLQLADIWHPKLSILNELNLSDLLPWVVDVTADGQVTFIQRLIGEFSARMGLHDFPYDQQSPAIHLVSLGFSPEEVQLQPETALTGGMSDFSVSGWSLTLGQAETINLEVPSSNLRVARVLFYIDAARDIDYYRWTMYLPLILIVLMAWMVFWIDPSQFGSQIGLSTAAIFSLIAFRFSMRASLPAVSYMTRMDMFLLGCTVLVFLALGQAVVTGRLVNKKREQAARNLDHWGRWIYLAGFILLCILYL